MRSVTLQGAEYGFGRSQKQPLTKRGASKCPLSALNTRWVWYNYADYSYHLKRLCLMLHTALFLF